MMGTLWRIAGCAAMLLAASPVVAQERVVPADDIEVLFTSPDPKLHANKQVVYHIVRDLLEANHWELADRYLTERYIQHNPAAASGRDAVVRFFTDVLKARPKPIPARIGLPVVSVVAEGDLVVVGFAQEHPEPKDPSKTFTTTWFDMWRIKDGKADEHWDPYVKK